MLPPADASPPLVGHRTGDYTTCGPPLHAPLRLVPTFLVQGRSTPRRLRALASRVAETGPLIAALSPTLANHALCVAVSPFLSQGTLAPTVLSAMPLSTSRLRARLSAPSPSSLARRSWSARSRFSSLASPSRTRRPRVPILRVPVLKVRAAASLLAAAAGRAVAVADVPVVVVAAVV